MNKDILQKIPQEPGIYIFKDKKEKILYIGKAKNLHKRVAQYFSPNSLRKQDMLSKADKIDVLIVKNESEALYLEDNLIKKHKPEFNNLLKADNSYAYLKITDHPFPQIFLTRKKINDASIYIGPKHNTISLKKFLQYLRQILQFRTCKDSQFKQGKVCSDYYFGLCRGWCDKTKNLNTKTYQKIIGLIQSFFKGNTSLIQNEIKKQIEQAVENQNFERAAKLRDIYFHIDTLTEQQTVVIPKPITGYFYKIKKIGNFRVYCILNFYEGKLIDIIRSKENIEDMDEDELKKTIERECFPLIEEKKITKSELKNIYHLIEGFFESYLVSTSFQEENLNNDVLSELQKRYHIKHFPYRIECIDISHISGGWISGGISCFVEGFKNPKGYRRYKIQNSKEDDYAALEEVLERRIKAGNLPDLLILDGGKGQLGIIKKSLSKNEQFKKILEKMDIISLGKGEARKKSKIGKKGKQSESIAEKIYFFDKQFKIHAQNLVYDEVDKLLLKARDEAHRFANAYRKKQMSKEFSS